MELKENDYALWLMNVPGVGNTSLVKLMNEGLSCRQIYEMDPKDLPEVLSKNKREKIRQSKAAWDFEAEDKKLRDKGVRFISCLSEEFPQKLKDIPNAPFGIYVKGHLPKENTPSVAIIGARMCSDYGRFMARQFGRDLALAGVQVISGMARGVDGIAQGAALAAGGTSFCVLGCGVDICYPEENRKIYDALLESGGIISEYPSGMQPIANFFPLRNRIISALSDVVLVVEARQKSGTTITVDTALEQGREVLAVPGRVTDRLSDGCNYLISQGAGIAVKAEDVLDRLWINASARQKEDDNESCIDDEIEDFEAYNAGGGSDNSNFSLEKLILEIVDIIPVSTSFIMDELYRRGVEIAVPMLITTLMDMISTGQIIQNGAYYRRLSV